MRCLVDMSLVYGAADALAGAKGWPCETREAFADGWQAAARGLSPADCPSDRSEVCCEAWRAGWERFQLEAQPV